MISTIIKGIKIPKYIGEHKEFDMYDGFLTVYKNGKVELHIFDTDYTIESIPTPHGRLIDADKLLESFREALDEDRHFVNFFALVDDSPTIIEAEVSE